MYVPSVADPGFLVGGGTGPLGVVLTFDVGTFRWKCMRKHEKLGPIGGAHTSSAPLDPPMAMYITRGHGYFNIVEHKLATPFVCKISGPK